MLMEDIMKRYTNNYEGDIATIGEGYTGYMDNLRIYNRALTQEEIKEIYKAKQ